MNLNEQIYRIKSMMGLSESVSDIQKTLRLNSNGKDVEELQKILNILVSGQFDSKTENCVKDFQTNMSIVVDGIVGPITKSYLQKLEDGIISWETPEYCKSKSVENEVLPSSDEDTNTGVDVILMGGLDYRNGDKSISQQVTSLKKTTNNKNIIGFRYNEPDKVIDAIKNNPNAYVVLFSAGGGYSSKIASVIKNKEKLFIVEPYALSSGTKQSVQNAVSSGVPNKNVITGPNSARGNEVVGGTTQTPEGIGHWGALEYVGKFIV